MSKAYFFSSINSLSVLGFTMKLSQSTNWKETQRIKSVHLHGDTKRNSNLKMLCIQIMDFEKLQNLYQNYTLNYICAQQSYMYTIVPLRAYNTPWEQELVYFLNIRINNLPIVSWHHPKLFAAGTSYADICFLTTPQDWMHLHNDWLC